MPLFAWLMVLGALLFCVCIFLFILSPHQGTVDPRHFEDPLLESPEMLRELAAFRKPLAQLTHHEFMSARKRAVQVQREAPARAALAQAEARMQELASATG
jgi:hypothetical protein